MTVRSILSLAASRAGAAIDRRALVVMERSMTGSRRHRAVPTRPRERLLALAEHYAGADLFAAPGSHEIEERPVAGRPGVFDLRFSSLYRPSRPDYVEELASYTGNGVACARLFRGGATPRPTVIWIHGWGGGAFWFEERAADAAGWLEAGFDLCLALLPFHGSRAPAASPRSGSLFPSTNAVRTNEAFGQAIHDLRVLARHLRERGAPSVGACGMSLGGYTTALWARLDPELAFAAAVAPAVDLAELMWRHGKGSALARRAEKDGIGRDLFAEVYAVHAPTAAPVLLPPDRLAIAAGRGDRVCPPDQPERLAEHWNLPRIEWFAGGHLAQIGRGTAFRALRQRIREGLG